MYSMLLYLTPIFSPPVDFYDQTPKLASLYPSLSRTLPAQPCNSLTAFSPKWAPKLFYWDIYDKKITIRLKHFICPGNVISMLLSLNQQLQPINCEYERSKKIFQEKPYTQMFIKKFMLIYFYLLQLSIRAD